ncbi:hypothetical protein BDZ97DRAFT_1924514 [Flammula alnicola]|nr:hypothetical protein BDZ97DRAFT_1924514 [Flammula alnicola]
MDAADTAFSSGPIVPASSNKYRLSATVKTSAAAETQTTSASTYADPQHCSLRFGRGFEVWNLARSKDRADVGGKSKATPDTEYDVQVFTLPCVYQLTTTTHRTTPSATNQPFERCTSTVWSLVLIDDISAGEYDSASSFEGGIRRRVPIAQTQAVVCLPFVGRRSVLLRAQSWDARFAGAEVFSSSSRRLVCFVRESVPQPSIEAHRGGLRRLLSAVLL